MREIRNAPRAEQEPSVDAHAQRAGLAVDNARLYEAAKGAAALEDPITGSLNASLAGWLLETGRLSTPYVRFERPDWTPPAFEDDLHRGEDA